MTEILAEVQEGMVTPRDIYGKTLVELGQENKRIVVLDADLHNSTRSVFFANRFPERFFEVGIAEQNMVGTAAGLALTGLIPFVNSFASFLTGRAYDQIRVAVAYQNLNVKLCGSSAGLSDAWDGATHQSIEDISLMRSLPNMTIVVPADAVETREATREIARHTGPVYLRLYRTEISSVFSPAYQFRIGEAVSLREGRDVTIFACGIMVKMALDAAVELAQQGIEAKVVNVSTIKPLDEVNVIKCAKSTGFVVVAEEHTIIGGLGSAVMEVLSKECIPVERVGIRDSFGQSCLSHTQLLSVYHLTKEEIVKKVTDILKIGR